MDKAKFADGVTRLLTRKTRVASVMTALVLLLAVGCVGAVLASRAAQLRQELVQSQIVVSLRNPAEKNRLYQILAAPENARLFMRYVDSLGVAAENLEVTPRQSFLCFLALLDAEKAAGASLKSFSGDAGGGWVLARCVGDSSAATPFFESLMASDGFSKVEILESDAENPQEFTIKCYF